MQYFISKLFFNKIRDFNAVIKTIRRKFQIFCLRILGQIVFTVQHVNKK